MVIDYIASQETKADNDDEIHTQDIHHSEAVVKSQPNEETAQREGPETTAERRTNAGGEAYQVCPWETVSLLFELMTKQACGTTC